MDSTTPPSRSRTKSASRLARAGDFTIDGEEFSHRSVGLVCRSPHKTRSPSTLSLRSSASLSFQDLLLLSPSPVRRSKSRLADRLEMAEEPMDPARLRRRRKTKGSQVGSLGCASPRGVRRSRRRSEMDVREEKDFGLVEEIEKPRKRRHSGRSNKEKLSLVSSMPSSNLSPKSDADDRGSLDQMRELLTDLIMWEDVAKSTLWFGFGSLCFFSSCFASGVSFSIVSAVCQLGLMFLGASFFSKSICQRDKLEEYKLKEDDILRFLKLILPAANLAISKTREIFCGEPAMTLKVAPFLLLGAHYGHLITLWRFCAIGYFISFTVPKLYSCYDVQINERVNCLKWRLLEAWGTCSHKKIVVASAITVFWNVSTIKLRIFTAFISLVILRYCRQHIVPKLEEVAHEEQKRALVVVKAKQEDQQALVVIGRR